MWRNTRYNFDASPSSLKVMQPNTVASCCDREVAACQEAGIRRYVAALPSNSYTLASLHLVFVASLGHYINHVVI